MNASASLQHRSRRLSVVSWVVSVAVLMGPIVAAPPAHAAVAAAIDVRATHPRLLVQSENDFVTVRSQTATDAVSARLQKNVLNSADYQLTQPVVTYDLRDPSASLKTAKALVDRAYSLALAWRLTGASKYMEGLWSNLDAASRFPDWASDNVLQVSEISHAFAIAYDWGYSYWTEARRGTLRNAILDKGLRPTLEALVGPERILSAPGAVNARLHTNAPAAHPRSPRRARSGGARHIELPQPSLFLLILEKKITIPLNSVAENHRPRRKLRSCQ